MHPLYTSFGEKLDKTEARKKLNLGAEEKTILFFGLIREYKGLDLLLEAMADVRIKDLNVKILVMSPPPSTWAEPGPWQPSHP